jgi:hypothetical protein
MRSGVRAGCRQALAVDAAAARRVSPLSGTVRGGGADGARTRLIDAAQTRCAPFSVGAAAVGDAFCHPLHGGAVARDEKD